MNKELIEKLREKADSLTTTVGVMNLLHEAADALEAKAAPVGEREAFEAEWKRVIIDEANTPEKHKAFVCFSLGAAYQRAQQPQSAEAWTPATTHPPYGEIVLTNHGLAYMTEKQPGVWFERLENLGIGRRLAATAVKQWRKMDTPQPSAGVVMPEIPWQWSKSLTHCWPDDKDDREGDWCVGCIDEEGNFYEVVKVEASQYDAAGESQKIAESIVALWEFARLNGKEVGRG